ncbi:signal peptidase [Geodermatophilus tzadiensis]|uniref:Signal peptidase n=1 Tax=Geodermatophilus tzadiensis TaxID=1137988 RepID=A0A2T0TQL0_9ACTN|nr:LamG-like jellyroll fold domain-containing protein [Geodermatophilus tzadiensis]PRY47975.1 signal peptidase [Geodermatophilus tzadiensis]
MTTDPAPAVRGRSAGRRSGGAWRCTWAVLTVSMLARGLLGTLAGLLLWSVVPVAAGWESSVVVSGSMAPTLDVGDVVLARPVTDGDVTPGQVLLVDDPDHAGRLRLHRLVEATDAGLVLRGDANARADSTPVDRSAVHGVGALKVPVIGSPLVWLGEHRPAPLVAGALVLVGLAAVALLYRPPVPVVPARPAPGRHRAPVRRRPGRLFLVVALAAATAVALPVVSPGWAGFVATTAGSTGQLDSIPHYSCLNAAGDVGAGGITGAAVADRFYPLTETTGATAADTVGTAANGTYQGGYTLGAPGPCPRDGGRAVTLNGSTGYVSTATTVTAATSLSVEVWFRTTTTSGGVLLTLASSPTGASNSTDRLLYLANDGRLWFGLQPANNTVQTISSPGAYNDGAWHHVAVTLTSGSVNTGSRLYADGALVAASTSMTTARTTGGYPRIGYDQLSKDPWPVRPTSNLLAGSLAGATFSPGVVLTAAQVADHHTAGR